MCPIQRDPSTSLRVACLRHTKKERSRMVRLKLRPKLLGIPPAGPAGFDVPFNSLVPSPMFGKGTDKILRKHRAEKLICAIRRNDAIGLRLNLSPWICAMMHSVSSSVPFDVGVW